MYLSKLGRHGDLIGQGKYHRSTDDGLMARCVPEIENKDEKTGTN